MLWWEFLCNWCDALEFRSSPHACIHWGRIWTRLSLINFTCFQITINFIGDLFHFELFLFKLAFIYVNFPQICLYFWVSQNPSAFQLVAVLLSDKIYLNIISLTSSIIFSPKENNYLILIVIGISLIFQMHCPNAILGSAHLVRR